MCVCWCIHKNAQVKQVKAAEADAEARYLSGLGVARQRRAIVSGLQESVGTFSDQVEGATPKDVMDILLLSQYFDTLSVVGANSLILEHDPGAVAVLRNSIGNSFLKNLQTTENNNTTATTSSSAAALSKKG
jgi:hypothetical protein